MGNYYVRKTGNDGTGDGSTGAPWLTISKALATVPIAGNHTILVGDGTYSENTSGLNYLLVQRVFLDWVTVQPELGAAGVVTVTNPGHATYCVRLDNSAYTRLKWLSIVAGADITSQLSGPIHLSGTSLSNFEFVNCAIMIRSVAAKLCYGFIIDAPGVLAYSDILFDGCTIVQTGTDPAYGIRVDAAAVGASVSNVTIRNCNITTTRYAIFANAGVTNLLVDGGVYHATGAGMSGAELGVNGAPSYPVTGAVRNATFISDSGHALLVGGGCAGVTVDNCLVMAGDDGIVVKNCDGAVLTKNQVVGGAVTQNALYFKGATNAIARNNNISTPLGACVKVGVDSGTGNKCQNITVVDNRIVARGSADIFSWGDATHDLGGGVCDRNRYAVRSTGDFGDVWGTLNIKTITALRAAWATYDVTTNDAQSKQQKRRVR